MHNRLTGCTGGSCGHGHTEEVVFVHVGRYSMPVTGMSQGCERIAFGETDKRIEADIIHQYGKF